MPPRHSGQFRGNLTRRKSEPALGNEHPDAKNYIYDCYGDCTFYEQFQYEGNSQSSALFMCHVLADNRLSRQAIIQIYNSFNSGVRLTASRAPSPITYFIPYFSIY